MKKTLWMLGVAVAALTSCTQSEVLDVPESRVIQFDTFVGKSTRAAIPINQYQDSNPAGGTFPMDNLFQFWVYGKINGEELFTGTDAAAKVYYSTRLNGFTYDNHKMWDPGETYSFAAYSNGNTPLVTLEPSNPINTVVQTAPQSISFEEETDNQSGEVIGSKIIFSDYEVGDYDLLAAIVPTATLAHDQAVVGDVPLYFQHMLSMINVRLENNTEEEYILIDDITFEGVKKDDCTYAVDKNKVKSIIWGNTVSGITITDDMKDDYVLEGTPITVSGYDGATDEDRVSEDNYLGPGETFTLTYFVIPQNNQDFNDIDLKMQAFKKETDIEGDEYFEKATANPVTKKMSLAVNVDGHTSWQPGYVYNYHGSLNGIAHYIHFDVKSIEDWSANGVDVNSSGSNIQ